MNEPHCTTTNRRPARQTRARPAPTPPNRTGASNRRAHWATGPAVLALALLGGSARAQTDAPLVVVNKGSIRGAYDGDSAVFRGIRYATQQRFTGPLPVPAREGHVIDALDYGPGCRRSDRSPDATQRSEDCLFLNVTAPRDMTKKSPVMVFVHGGRWQFGSGDYDATVLSEHGEGATVVTINHRLGVYGFTWLDALNATDAASDGMVGNYAMRDTLAALRWVKQNIAAFGGDSERVTVFGVSSGGHIMCSLLASPEASTLIDGVIMQSGACSAVPPEKAEADNTVWLRELGCEHPGDEVAVRDCLMVKSADEIAEAADGSAQPGLSSFAPSVVIDGVLLPEHPLVSIQQGRHNDVPVIIGSNKNEVPGPAFVTAASAYGWGKGIDWLLRDTGEAVADDVARLRDHYSPANFGTHMGATYHLHHDVVYRCPNLSVAKALHEHGGENVYFYEFDFPTDLVPSGHSLEAIALFRGHTLPFALIPSFKFVQDNILDRWSRFAHWGDPNSDCRGWFCDAKWHPFDESTPVYDFGNLVEHDDLDYSGCDVLAETGLPETIGILSDRDVARALLKGTAFAQ